SNGADATGDGYAAALRVGCALQDMEFVQYTPTAFAAPAGLKGHTIVGTLLTLPDVRLLNVKGERFMERYAPDLMEAAGRATLARAIYREVQEGRGTDEGAVYLDATAVSAEAFNRHRPGFYDMCRAHGVDPCKEPLQTAPSVHTCLGGIKAGSDLKAAENLFVAGEVMAGMHGANRLSSNSLTEANVTGWRAGESAAAWASAHEDAGEFTTSFQLPGSGGTRIANLHCRLQQFMADAAGVERDAKSLRAGLDALTQIHLDCEAARHAGVDTVTGWLGVRNMALVAEAILGSALERSESRGAHFRTDYPDPSNELGQVNVCCTLEDSALSFHRVPGA
ncbi:MAG: FAD-binding protein, partial [Pseudomonadota bacterium]